MAGDLNYWLRVKPSYKWELVTQAKMDAVRAWIEANSTGAFAVKQNEVAMHKNSDRFVHSDVRSITWGEMGEYDMVEVVVVGFELKEDAAKFKLFYPGGTC
jgi:hypothetical protein